MRAIYEVAPDGTGLTPLYSFTGTNGNSVGGLILGNDGNFYGTSGTGGSSNNGNVFRLTPSGDFTELCAFNGTNGAGPDALPVQGTDGSFYGTTMWGGANSAGEVYRLTTNGLLTVLYSFTGGTDGGVPEASVVQGSDGNFYGSTNTDGNSHGAGTLFEVTPHGGFSTLYTFSGTDGNQPRDMILGNDGNLCVTYEGGTANDGTAFKLAPNLTITGSAVAFSCQVNATNNPTSYTATGLPAGLTINASTGLISGTAGASGTFCDFAWRDQFKRHRHATLTIVVQTIPAIASPPECHRHRWVSLQLLGAARITIRRVMRPAVCRRGSLSAPQPA